jgi:hypothetical protein
VFSRLFACCEDVTFSVVVRSSGHRVLTFSSRSFITVCLFSLSLSLYTTRETGAICALTEMEVWPLHSLIEATQILKSFGNWRLSLWAFMPHYLGFPERQVFVKSLYSKWCDQSCGTGNRPAGVENFLFATVPGLALGSTQPPIPWAMSLGVKRPLTTHFRLVRSSRMRRAIPPFLTLLSPTD